MNNSPPRYGYRTQAPVRQYNGSYNNRPFIPSTYTGVAGYNCVSVSPNTGALFYRMDKRLGFTGNESAADVFGIDRNTYFGIRPKDIMDAYKTHTHLYVVEPNTPIVLIDMGVLENVQKLMSNATKDVVESIRTAFPIKNGIVARYSEPASEHDGIDHDRRVLEYICSLPNIDGYYVDADGLHPEIGFCKASLQKLDVVNMFRVRTEVQERRVQNTTRKRERNFTPMSLSFNNMISANNNSLSSPKISRSLFGKLSFNGGKRKTRKTHKKRRTQRK